MIAWEGLRERLNADGEFRVSARLWSATLRLDVGNDSHALRIENGAVESVESCESDAGCDVRVSAPEEVWARMLEPVPRPFYHDLFAAQVHHGLVLGHDELDYAPYYPALKRLLEVLRTAGGEN